MNKKSLVQETAAAVVLVFLLLVPSAFGQKERNARQTNTPLSIVFAPGGSIVGDLSEDPSEDPSEEEIYKPYTDQSENVRAEITYGNFYLDTNENKGDGGRRVSISTICSGSIGGIPCPDPGPKDVYVATIDPADVHVDLADLSLGESWNKRFAITWAEGDYTYYLRWNNPVDPQHGNICFTCTATDLNGACVEWVAGPTGLVGLFAKSTERKSTQVYVTSADMPFQMTLVKQP
jgi:hypothetical protein